MSDKDWQQATCPTCNGPCEQRVACDDRDLGGDGATNHYEYRQPLRWCPHGFASGAVCPTCKKPDQPERENDGDTLTREQVEDGVRRANLMTTKERREYAENLGRYYDTLKAENDVQQEKIAAANESFLGESNRRIEETTNLRAERDALREALQEQARGFHSCEGTSGGVVKCLPCRARAALEGAIPISDPPHEDDEAR